MGRRARLLKGLAKRPSKPSIWDKFGFPVSMVGIFVFVLVWSYVISPNIASNSKEYEAIAKENSSRRQREAAQSTSVSTLLNLGDIIKNHKELEKALPKELPTNSEDEKVAMRAESLKQQIKNIELEEDNDKNQAYEGNFGIATNSGAIGQRNKSFNYEDDRQKRIKRQNRVIIKQELNERLEEISYTGSEPANWGKGYDIKYDRKPLLAKTIERVSTNAPQIINSTGNRVKNHYDGLNRITSKELEITSDGNGGSPVTKVITTRYEYDGNSRLTAEIDDNGNRTEYRYDALNRKTQTIYPDRSSDLITYDPNDNIIGYRDVNGNTTTCTYDALNRLTDCSINRAYGVEGTTSIHYDYDGLSRVVRTAENNDPANGSEDVRVEYSYDSLSRIIERREHIADGSPDTIISFDWEGENRITAISYPNGRKITNKFDQLDRITSIDGTAAYSYIGAYRIGERTLANGVTLVPEYDALRRTKELTHKQNQNTLAGFCYTYNRTNNRLSEIRHHDLDANGFERGEKYTYDSLYRLNDFEEGSFDANGSFLGNNTKSEQWQLDGVNNWTTFTNNGSQSTQRINNVNQYTSFGSEQLVYDGNKNLIEDGNFRYTYDFLNRLHRVIRKSDGQEVARYIYSSEGVNGHIMGAGRRIKKITPQGTERYCWDGGRIIEVRDGSGRVSKQFVYGAKGEPIRIDIYDSTGTTTNNYYYIENSIGSIVGLTDKQGNVVERYTYDAYGKPEFRNPDNTLKQVLQSEFGNPLLFAGSWYDPETGNYYNQHRYYNTSLGRFNSQDPAGIWHDIFNLGNAYTYVGNNPINRIDPLGLKQTVVFGFWGYELPGGDAGDGIREIAAGIRNLTRINPHTVSYEQIEAAVRDIEGHMDLGGKECTNIALYGHSYGGDAAIDVARKLMTRDNKKVNYLALIDAEEIGTGSIPKFLPPLPITAIPNVADEAINFYETEGSWGIKGSRIEGAFNLNMSYYPGISHTNIDNNPSVQAIIEQDIFNLDKK